MNAPAAGWLLPALLTTALLSGAAVALRPAPRLATDAARVWTFAPNHATQLRDIAGLQGITIDLSTIAARPLDVRLQSLHAVSPDAAPLLVELEIGTLGKYLRGRATDVPLLPLGALLRAAGWDRRIVPARLAAWSRDGEPFAVPLDVHPVALVYRADLLAAARVDLSNVATWADLHRLALAFEIYERANGRATRALQLPRGGSDVLMMLLQQRGIDPIDAADRPHLADPRVVDTLVVYAHLVTGPTRVASDPTPGPGRWADDLASGAVAMALVPDWALSDLRRRALALAGKLAARPLPRFDPTDAPTASWGGTAVAIPRDCPTPDAAWQLLQQLYLSDAARQVRAQQSDVLPAIVDWWPLADDRPDPLFVGPAPQRVYRQLASSLPPRTVTPFTALASAALSLTLYRATAALDGGASDAELRRDVQRWLADAAADVERRIAFAKVGS